MIFGIPFGTEVDMWSLGCVLAELYLGESLFGGVTKEELLHSVSAFSCVLSSSSLVMYG